MKTKTTLLFICLSLISYTVATAQWAHTALTGGTVNCLATDGTRIYAGTSNIGLQVSPDGGANWTYMSTGLPSAAILSLAVSGNTIYAGTESNGIYVSTDNAANWTLLGLSTSTIQAILVNGATIFVGTPGGVQKSIDSGANWAGSSIGMSFNNIQAFNTDGTYIYAGSSQVGVYRSNNDGASWLQGVSGLTSGDIRSVAIIGSNVFAGTGGKVSVSVNNGANWTAVDNGFTGSNVHALLATGNSLFAATSGPGAFVTSDNGANWTDITAGLSTNTSMNALVIMGGDIYIGSNGAGIWKSPLSGFITGSVPADPTNLTLTPQKTETAGQMLLDWTDNSSDEDGFGIQRSTDGTNFTSIDSVGANTNTFTDMGLTAGTVYYYRVFAFNATGNSGYSNTISATATGIEDAALLSEIKVFPNPLRGKLFVQLSNDILINDKLQLTILNFLGQEIKTVKLHSLSTVIETDNFSSGIYSYRIQDENHLLKTGKLIIE